MMKNIVITGSTHGIGFALARAFLRKGCRVVISGRQGKNVKDSVQKLAADFSKDLVAGYPCDVTQFDEVKSLWANAGRYFGQVDIWINNAGISNQQDAPWLLDEKEIKAVIETNILGEMYGSKMAMQGFLQQGFGALYNMEGMGANRRSANVKGLSIYGASKAGLRYFNDCLASENAQPNIIVGALQPGMVLTAMVTGQYSHRPDQWEKDRRILETLSSDVNEVADWLTDKMLNNSKNGARFSYSNSFRLFAKFLMMPFRKNSS
jgi:NAD(P)-dependent dehydrogenase (short-subunit alcohol dehydrogenase family)